MNKFKKSIIPVLAITAIILLTVGGYMLSKNMKNAAPSGNGAPATANQGSATTTPGSATSSLPAASHSTSSVASAKSLSNGTLSLTYPASWNVLNYHPLVLANFTKYDPNGAIPSGGAEIDVVTTTVQGTYSDIMKTELMGIANVAMSASSVSGIPCARADYEHSVAGVSLRSASLYCQKGAELLKIYFSYRADDSSAATRVADFNSIIGSLKLLK